MKIKYISTIIGCATLMLSITSCQDFLDKTDPTEVTTGSYWQNLDDCESGLISVYNSFKDVDMHQYIADNKRSDITWPGISVTFPLINNQAYYTHSYEDDDNAIIGKWEALYRGIFRANQVIEGLNNIESTISSESDQETWNLIMGQATFFRALFHFYAYCSFNEGNVPIVSSVPTNKSEFYRECNARIDVEAFVREEMMKAEVLLPVKGASNDWSSSELGRIRADAASAILGMTYLYENEPAYSSGKEPNYTEAAKYFKKIIDNSNYKLAGVGDNFTTVGEFNSESILEINYTHDYNSEYAQSSQSSLAHNLSIKFAHKYASNGNVTLIPSYWLYRTYAKEPLDPLTNDKVTLKTDYHGDIYYYNQDDYCYDDPSNMRRTYFVVKKYEPGIASMNIKDFKYLGSPYLVEGNYYVFKKTITMDDFSSDIPVSNMRTKEQIENYTSYDVYSIAALGASFPPIQPYKNLRTDGTWIPEETGSTEPNSDGTIQRPIYVRNASVSPRTANSIAMMTDEDTKFYTSHSALHYGYNDASWGSSWAYFKKMTHWDTLDNEYSRSYQDSDVNLRMIRLADIYLLYAECMIEGGSNNGGVDEALKYINRVRARAGTILIGNSTSSSAEYVGQCTYQGDLGAGNYNLYGTLDLDGTSKDSDNSIITTASQIMDHLMYVERPLELSLEGHSTRFIDLRRWNITSERFKYLSQYPIIKTAFPHAFVSETGVTYSTNGCYTFDYIPGFEYDINNDSSYTPDYECIEAYQGYGTNNSKAYFPIPRDETTTNPNIVNVYYSDDSI